MATRPALLEVALFLRTLRRFDASRRVYVASDTAVAAYVSRVANATAVPCLVKYENYSRVWMKKKRWGPMNVWTHLQLEKTTVMARALDDGAPGVLFADADVAWLAPLPPAGAGAVGVSPCLCRDRVEATYGAYNGGHVFARTTGVLDLWRSATSRSRYMEQAALEEVYAETAGAFLWDARANVEWLNVVASHSVDGRDHAADLVADGDTVAWLGRRLLSAHAHVVPTANQPAFQRRALGPMLDALRHSAVEPDLCATHHLLCAGARPCAPADWLFDRRNVTVHVATFAPGHGNAATNYYHFFYGLLVPVLHWLEELRPRPGDVVVLNEPPFHRGATHRFLPQLLRLAGRDACVQMGVVEAPDRNGSGAAAAHVTLANEFWDWSRLDDAAAARYTRRPEWGLDYHLYGCGRFDDGARRELAARVAAARDALLRACRCAAASGAPRVLVIRREHRHASDQAHQNRSLANFDDVVAALRERPWAASHEVRVVDFGDADLCRQACETAAATAQHGAGQANMALLRGGGFAGVVEICPKPMMYKSIFQCLAALRGVRYARVEQPTMHGPVDVAAVAAAADAAVAAAGSPAAADWPRGGHHLKVCDTKNAAWRAPIACGYG
ncbi:hypothetical protein AURANDRAFT_65256 [Aureococcus anophagefferens]|uniref:Nucleotide-diphospho-sugar transferase domain-containing protein n=1 Tax=Aureococcus anophagefferens TaxID=44056 RepID=F0YD93_AURAN|nr:hypothetical protein AURANDRAFT_65256 [Aureococcus anophagefferens]EGB07021.1 hypothetical protein AURANDRAFT_65256 [Aureococcus anophagefferens]|eukprot:XP_009038258.1 hypothetical protein AURANDRAFT_65256 [Aureococcus anophagefferens]